MYWILRAIFLHEMGMVKGILSEAERDFLESQFKESHKKLNTYLLEEGQATIRQLMQASGLTKQSVINYLNTLQAAGIIELRREHIVKSNTLCVVSKEAWVNFDLEKLRTHQKELLGMPNGTNAKHVLHYRGIEYPIYYNMDVYYFYCNGTRIDISGTHLSRIKTAQKVIARLEQLCIKEIDKILNHKPQPSEESVT